MSEMLCRAVFAASVMLAACESEPPKPIEKGQSVAEQIENHAPAAAERLAAIEKLEGALATTKPEGKPPSGIEFFLSGSDLKSSANAVLLYDDQLRGGPTKRYAAIFTGDAVSACHHLVKLSKDMEESYKTREATGIDRTTYEICAGLKYAVVIRVTKEQKPVVGKTVEETNTTPFEPGRIEADVLVFELPTGKLAGGVSVAATNREAMDLDKFTDTLEDDLRVALYAEIVKHVPVPETKSKKYLQ